MNTEISRNNNFDLYNTYDKNGNLVGVNTTDGVNTVYYYDEHNNKTSMIDYKARIIEYYEYDEKDRLIYTKKRLLDSDNVSTVKCNIYDSDNITEIPDPIQGCSYIVYDTNGNKIIEYSDFGYSYYFYDTDNNLTHAQLYNGKTYYMKYNERRELIEYSDNMGYKEEYQYMNGNKISYKDSRGVIILYDYFKGNLVREINGNTDEIITSYFYDGNNNILCIDRRDIGAIEYNFYDKDNKKIRSVNDFVYKKYEYNSCGQLVHYKRRIWSD